MKQHLLAALITLIGLFALAAGAQADTSAVVVNIDQDFVAGRKALPAGKYRVAETGQALILQGEQPGATTFLLPTTHYSSSSERLEVKLTRVGDVYYLSKVATERGVYTLATPRMVTRTAKARHLEGMSSSGTR